MADSFSKDKFYRFNLIPPISEEEIKKIESRDNSIIYVFALLVLGFVFYLFFTVLENRLVQARLESLNEEIIQIEIQNESNAFVIEENGELITKGNNLLKPLLENDIELRDRIDISDEVAAAGEVSSYELDAFSNRMTLTVVLSNPEDAIEVFRAANLNTNTTEVLIESLARNRLADEREIFILVISFRLEI